MRCESCAKFVSMDDGEPEVSDESASVSSMKDGVASVSVTCSVRIVRTCAECSNELKEATLDLEGEVEHKCAECNEEGEEPELEVSVADVQATYEGGGRYQKSYCGAQVSLDVKCSTCGADDMNVIVEDKVPASWMDELC